MITVASNRPFFSIIIPTFNRAKLLKDALGSIMNQEFADYEIIVVDDGSTDNTSEVVLNAANENSCVKYFFKQNEERSIARNYGIMRASGMYIGFLDSDDIVYPHHLRKAHELLTMNNYPQVGHLGYKIINEKGETLLTKNDFNESFKKKLIHENSVSTNAIFIRRDIILEMRFIPNALAVISEDWCLWLQLASRYPFYFDNTVTSAVVQHGERSLMKIEPNKLIASTTLVVECLKNDETFKREYKGRALSHFANHYTFLALIMALTRSRRRETLIYLVKAIKYDPSVVLRKRFMAAVKHLL